MKKQLTVFAAAAMLASVMSTTGFAAETNPTGGKTEVYVGVTQTAPKSISVTVPTSLAIAVVAEGTTVQTLMGNHMVDSNGDIVNSGDSAQGITKQRITFVNTGEVDAKVVSAKVVNTLGSNWTIKNTDPVKYQMSMSLNNVSVGEIGPDENSIITLGDFELKKNNTTHMPAAVAAGGSVADYATPEKSAKSFVIEWNIAAK